MASRYKFSDKEIAKIERARKANQDNRTEVRRKALELRAKGMKAEDVAKEAGFHSAYITTLVRKYRNGGLY